jgi:hypothetical protein
MSAPVAAHSLGPDSLLRRREDLVEMVLDDEVVLLDERTGTLFRLNVSAAAAWAQFDGTRPLGSVTRTLAAGFGVEPRGVRADVVGLVRELVALGLVTVHGAADDDQRRRTSSK